MIKIERFPEIVIKRLLEFNNESKKEYPKNNKKHLYILSMYILLKYIYAKKKAKSNIALKADKTPPAK